MSGVKSAIATAIRVVSPRLSIEIDIWRRNRHFEPEFWLLPQLCQGAETAVDVGGNMGLFAYYMAKSAKAVHVFEPNPACLDQIQRLKRPNMVIHPVGLSDAAAELTLRYDPGNTGIGTVEVANTLTQNASIRSIVEMAVRVQQLDDFGLTGVAFIKIDVEGHEAAVVRGAKATIAASMPILLIESELRHNPDGFGQLFAVLAPMGYEARRLAGRAWQKVRPGDLATLQVAGDGTANNFFFVPRNRLPEFGATAV